MLDRIDKAIIKLLLAYEGKFLTTNQIAIKIKISPLTGKRHLEKLEREGYLKVEKSKKIREYEKKHDNQKN